MHENFALQGKAATLARLAPQQWSEFLIALSNYVEVQRNQLVNSGLPELPVHQGRAQFGTNLVLLLADCVAADDKAKRGKQ